MESDRFTKWAFKSPNKPKSTGSDLKYYLDSQQKSKNHFNRFGWESILYEVAESGLFSKTGYTAIESVRISDFYAVLKYVAFCNSKPT